MLDIVLRTCDHTDVHPERGSRFIETDKATLIKKCFVSLINSINLAKENFEIKLWILDDHSETSLLNFISNTCKRKDIDYEIISLQKKGYNNSAFRQFSYCKEIGRKWVYSVEDDYLHFPEAINILLAEAESFSINFGTLIAIRPDDDLFTYSSNANYSKYPCRLFLGKDRHWRTLHNTHNTIFTHVDVFKEYWELFAALATQFRKTSVNEDGTINTIWSDGVNKPGPVPLISPIPSLAIHISQNNEPFWIDYKKLWDSININDS